ncbi:hypothetical protein AGDE_03026 [Angomonas deanei]|uniref:Uncharacterized protein n=1 Tax=Angomonas deanei TaxID=59799 RepID=S9VTX0_9TRYP|nr:hypothetical protein AGDE_11156 [Angomonas deanei]EPY38752.1 hypothetical protein AGDE_05177 [Angomonas deanei]EPY40900.1 hypothetical protein AGDE_03026 [Angomonas deanei]CAD2217415.1 hypothetical protein, conserved [Angomonas deanei]|eukprot:EPY26660.1 hypothetical protein AGDE_11156 [Angomonas deanei]
MVPRSATIHDVIQQVIIENQSPYLCNSNISLSIDGVELDPAASISDYNLHEMSQIDAVEDNDHLLHTENYRPKDWNVDEMTSEDSNVSPYKEMNMQPNPNLTPRYEGKPKGFHGKNDYSGMKQTS